jgi:hypothetical protein
MSELKSKIVEIIKNIREYGQYPKECDVDYKESLNKNKITSEELDTNNPGLDIFLSNFFEDLLSFANGDGGYILLGFQEGKSTGNILDKGLEYEDINILKNIDLTALNDKVYSYTKVNIDVDLQYFKISNRECYYFLIEKSNQILISDRDDSKFKLKQGKLIYRKSGTNCHANKTSSEFSNFILRKANERSREYLDMWRELLPDMVDINPKDVLIINHKSGFVYGFGKELVKLQLELNSKSKNGLNLMLNAIQADDIGKISSSGDKPIFRMMGDINLSSQKVIEKERAEKITIASAVEKINSETGFSISNEDFKKACFYLKITNTEKFYLEDSTRKSKKYEVDENIILDSECLFVSTVDSSKNRRKIMATNKCISMVLEWVKKIENQKTYLKKDFSSNKHFQVS